MKETNEKKCPSCESTDIIETNDRTTGCIIQKISGTYPTPDKIIYQCKKCKHYFSEVDI